MYGSGVEVNRVMLTTYRAWPLTLFLVLLTVAGCGSKDLHQVVSRENVSASAVEDALEAGADPNARNEFGSTPLHFTWGEDTDPEITRALIEGGADVNAVNDDGETPLHEAAWGSENPVIVELLLDAGADTEIATERGQTPLHRAAAHGTPEIVQLLLERGANLHVLDDAGNTPLDEALTTRQIFLEDGLVVPRMLLEHGADPGGRTLWRFATPGLIVDGEQDMGDPEIVALLLEYGADANMTDPQGGSLLIAVGSPEIARLLIEHGADVNAGAPDIGWTPLHAAVGSGDLELIELYLDSGADIEAQDLNGTTPLKTAILAEDLNLGIVALLLDRGADPFAEHYGIATPCRSARSFDTITDPEILERLCSDPHKDDRNREEAPEITPTPGPVRLAGLAESPIHWAAGKGSADDVAALLDEGTPIETTSSITLTDHRTLRGVTPLHIAVLNRDPAVIDLLLDRGADINAMTTTGETPCDLARQVEDGLAGAAALDRLCGG